MAVSSKIEEMILEIAKNIGNISDALELGIGDINIPSSSIFEINNLKSTAQSGYPYFGIIESDPLGFGITYDRNTDKNNVTIGNGVVSYNNSLIKIRDQKIPIKKEFLKNYSLDPEPDNFKYGITVGLSYDDITKTVQTFNSITSYNSSSGSTFIYVNSSAIADTLGYPLEAHVGSQYLKFISSGFGGTALFIDPAFYNGSEYGKLSSNVSSDTSVKFIYQPKLSYLTGFPVSTTVENPELFKYFPPNPYSWLPVANILIKNPSDPIVAGINTDAYIRTVVDMPTSTSQNPILGNSDDKNTIIEQCDLAITNLTNYKNNLSISEFVNSISSYTLAQLDNDANSFNSFWSKQPFRQTQYYSKGVSFSGLERFEFPQNYSKAHYNVSNYDIQHTFGIFRGDLVSYNSAVLSSASILSNEINCNVLTSNDSLTSLKAGSQIYGISAVCSVDGTNYQETVPTYKSLISTDTTFDPYVVDLNFTGLGVTNPLFYHIYKRPFTSSEVIEKRLTNINEIIYNPITSWTPVNDNNYLSLSYKYLALKFNVLSNCFIGGFSIKMGFDATNKVGFGQSTINFMIHEDYENDGYPNAFASRTSLTQLPYSEISSGYKEYTLKFKYGMNAVVGKTYYLIIEKLYDFITTTGTEILKIRYNPSFSDNIIYTSQDFDGSENWTTLPGKAYFTLKGFIDDGKIEGYAVNRGVKQFDRISNIPRRLSVYVPNVEDLLDDTGLLFNGSGLAITTVSDKSIKNELFVSVVAKNGQDGIEKTLTTTVPKGTARDTRFLLGTSSDLFDRVVSISVSPGLDTNKTSSGAVIWDIYDLITIETEP